jgi:hypothetical protein
VHHELGDLVLLQRPAHTATTFRVYAWDSDGTSLRKSNSFGSFTAANPNQPPDPVSNLVASSAGGNTILSWNAPTQTGNRPVVDFYRIYRRPASPAVSGLVKPDILWRHDTTGSGSEVTWVDTQTDGQQWTYWVTSVGLQLSESGAARVTR